MIKKQKRTTPTAAFPLKWMAFIFLVALAVYTNTLNPSLFRNDSPETITACKTLGVSHPPSYPLHTLLGHLFSFLPIGNPAFSMNFFSAFLAAIGACLFFINLWILFSSFQNGLDKKKSGNSIPIITTVIGSLCFAFSQSYWSCALSAKGSIYILQTVFSLGILLLLEKAIFNAPDASFSKRNLYLLIFLITLGFTNHWPTQTLLLPAILSLAALHLRKRKKSFYQLKNIFVGGAVLLIALSLYLYLPLRANLLPALNFGAPFTSHRFFQSILRTDYAMTETLFSGASVTLTSLHEKALYISNHFLDQVHFSFLLFIIFGLFFLMRRGVKTRLFFYLVTLLVTLIANLFYLRVTTIDYWHLDDHLLTLNWVIGIIAAAGVFTVLVWSKSKVTRLQLPAPVIVGVGFLLFLPAITLLKNFPANNQKQEFLYYGFGLETLKSIRRGSIYFAEHDYDFFSTLYLQTIELKRSDITIFLTLFLEKPYEYELIAKTNPQGLFDHYRSSSDLTLDQRRFFKTLFSPLVSKPLYCAFPNGPFSELISHHPQSFHFRPEGILMRLLTRDEPILNRTLLNSLDVFWEKNLTPGRRSDHPISQMLIEQCAHPFLNTANYLRVRGDLTRWDWFHECALTLIKNKSWRAQVWLQKAEGDQQLGLKTLATDAYLGSIQESLSAGQLDLASSTLERALASDPLNADLQYLKNDFKRLTQ